jgi:serine/threonine-protein kinase
VASSVDGFPQDISPDAYTVERELGRGGMATVYAVRDAKHGRPVALKVLRPELAASLGAERFRREITLAASLQHPHIVSVYDSGETPSGALWFTMPLIEGESLRDRLRRQHQLPIDEAIRITREVALALDYAHRHGVIHRDIKPENILLVDGQPMVSDFGVARTLAAGSPGETLTAPGMAIGTPAYMSPEQAAGERALDPATDIYSLGAVCYEMLTGEPPFPGPTAQAIAAKMMAGDLPSIRRVRPSVSEAIEDAVQKALAPVPADRYASGEAFAKALESAERTTLVSGSRAGTTPTQRRWPMVAAGALGLIAVLGVSLLWRTRQGNSSSAAGPVALAVLPFESESDTTNAYFADGIADEIRGKLSALPALQVTARASSKEYRPTQKSPTDIARELGVSYLLMGTVQWERSPSGFQRVRVSPELVEVTAGRAPVTKWQQSYDTTLADVFDVQSAVATRVADKLGVVLTPPAQTQLAARPTQSLAAYDAYLRSTALDGFDPATVRRALAAAEQAVALDSTFAAAWARVSTLHSLLYTTTSTRFEDDAARQAAERAVALAPEASAGYLARGYYHYFVTHDLTANRAAYETAARLDPSSAEALGAVASAEARAGEWATALRHARHATALDPRAMIASFDLTRLLLHLRLYRDARAEAERGLTVAPTSVALINYRALTWLGEGDLAGARAALRDVPPTLDRATLAAYVRAWWLDSADRALMMTLPPAAFDNNRRDWGGARADVYWLAGDTGRARRYADTIALAAEAQLRLTPNDYGAVLDHALALAYLGQRAAAAREGEHGFALARAVGDQYLDIPGARRRLAYIYVLGGDRAKAIGQLDSVLAKPDSRSPAWLKIDPTWAPLRGDPRFERLLAQPPVTFTSEAPESAR